LSRLKENYKFGDFLSYVNNTDVESREILEIVSLGPPDEEKDFILINTVLISIIKNKGRPFCNVLLKNFLDDKNCVVSIGSACLTNNESSSHVLSSIGAPSIIKRGVIRISFGDNNTISEIDKFIKLFKLGIEKQFVDVKKEMLEKPKNEKVHEKTDEKEIIIEK